MRNNRIIWLILFLLAVGNYIISESFVGLYVLVLVIGLPILSIALLFTATDLSKVEIEMPETAGKGLPLDGVIRLKNRNRIPIAKVVVPFRIRNRLTGESLSEEQGVFFAAGAESRIAFDFVSDLCGSILVELDNVRIYDFFGLISRKKSLASTGSTVVMPELFPMQVEVRQGSRANLESIEYSNYKPGFDPSEVFGIREYQEGDSVKNIHWKLSSKMDDLIVRLPSLPLENSILLILERIHETEQNPEVHAALAETFVTLSESLIHEQIRHRVAWFDRNEEQVLAFDVEVEDDVPSILARLLESEPVTDELRTIPRYQENLGAIDKAHLVYVAASRCEEMEDLPAELEKTSILCMENERGEDDMSWDIRYTATPASYREQFRQISI